jgi:hypothetical protein
MMININVTSIAIILPNYSSFSAKIYREKFKHNQPVFWENVMVPKLSDFVAATLRLRDLRDLPSDEKRRLKSCRRIDLPLAWPSATTAYNIESLNLGGNDCKKYK